jgi:uncharacterized membrane protein YgcG
VLLLYYIIVWVAVGRDPAAGTIVPLYEPPADLSPAAMRFLENMKFDAKTFTVGVLGLAAKGYLTIKQVDRHTYQLIRKEGWGVAEQKLAGDEKTLASKLFENGDKLDLVQSNHTQLQEAKKALQLALHGGMETRYFVTNRQFLWPGFAITAVTVGTALLIGHGPGAPVAIFMSIWLTGWTAGVVALVHNVIAAWRSVLVGSWLEAPGALFLTVFSLPFLAGEGFGIFVLSMSSGVPAVVVVLCAVFLNALFHHLLKSPTRLGRQLMDKAEGFTLFLKAVEGPQLNAAPPTTPETFERYLPYAVAMGVEHAWSQKFAHDLAVAGLAPQGGAYSPSWYVGSGFNAGSASDFTSSFSNSFSSAVSSASSSPASSSGSSGGGSSGGGGGGGGGGGW